MTDSVFRLFSKNIFPSNIVDLAKSKQLTFDDIFSEFGDRAYLTIYAFGYDSVTGARKIFVSKRYTITDIVYGSFRRSSNHFNKYNDYIYDILMIDKVKRKK